METADGILISRQEILATQALTRIGQAIREQGLTLDELIESGRSLREELIQEKYGITEQP